MTEIGVMGIRDTIIQLRPGDQFTRLKMTEQAFYTLLAMGGPSTYNLIEIPCLHSETHRAFWFPKGWEFKKAHGVGEAIVYYKREDLQRWMKPSRQ